MSKTTRKQNASSRSRWDAEPESRPLPAAPATAEITSEDVVSMARHSIQFDGRDYTYREFRYEKLGDAIAYARLMRSRNVIDHSRVAPANDRLVRSPGESQRQLMQQLSISFDGGVYKLGAFRYDKLADAVSYARICLRRYVAGQSESSDVLSSSDDADTTGSA